MNEVEMLALGDALARTSRCCARANASPSATTSSGSCGARRRSRRCSAATPGCQALRDPAYQSGRWTSRSGS
jgi:hypothetical protein